VLKAISRTIKDSNSQVSRYVLDIDQHRVLSHAQVITIHQVLHQHLVERFDEGVELVDDDLQLCDVHVGQHLSGQSTLCRWNCHADFVERPMDEVGDGAVALLLSFNLCRKSLMRFDLMDELVVGSYYLHLHVCHVLGL